MSAIAAKPAGEACRTCPARDAKIVFPEKAASRPKLAVVGEAPGRNELEKGRPFIGASGRMLGRGLRTIDLKRDQIHWTNAVLCEPPRKPKELGAARKACAKRLRDELRAVAPPMIVPVGALGLHSTLALPRKPSILKWRGTINPVEFPSEGSAPALASLVAPTIHPAFVMRASQWGPILEIDVERIGRYLERDFVAPEEQEGREIVVAKTRDQLSRALERLERARYLGFDVETVGLGAIETPLVCFALSDGKLTLVVPWSRNRAGSEPWWPFPGDVAAEISRVTTRARVVTHNGPAFDHIVADRYGIEIDKWDDTLLATHAVASHLPKGLSHVVSLRLDVTAWKEQEDRTADLPRLWVYNARDTLYTILAWLAIRREL